MVLYALLESVSRYPALDRNLYSAQRKYPSWKEDLSQTLSQTLFLNYLELHARFKICAS